MRVLTIFFDINMNTLKQRLENILIELESIKQLIERLNSEAEGLSSNDHVIEHLKDLQHILIIAKKIIHQLLIDNLDHEVQG